MSLSDYNSVQKTLYLFGGRTNAALLHAAMAEADVTLAAGAWILGPNTRRVAIASGSGAARNLGIKAAARARFLKQKMLLKKSLAVKSAKNPVKAPDSLTKSKRVNGHQKERDDHWWMGRVWEDYGNWPSEDSPTVEMIIDVIEDIRRDPLRKV